MDLHRTGLTVRLYEASIFLQRHGPFLTCLLGTKSSIHYLVCTLPPMFFIVKVSNLIVFQTFGDYLTKLHHLKKFKIKQ
jgi:hypothetical protein